MALDPLTAGLIGGGVSLLGGLFGGKKVADASKDAVREERRQFDIALGLARPSIEAGDTARAQLMRLLGLPVQTRSPVTGLSFGNDFRFPGTPSGIRTTFGGTTTEGATDPLDIIRNTPGFEFQTEQGRRALNAIRSAGGSSGGDLIRDFTRFNQGVASDFYRDYANRLANLAGTGQQAAQGTGSLAVGSGRGIAGSLLSAGEARASGITGAATGITDLIGQILRAQESG